MDLHCTLAWQEHGENLLSFALTTQDEADTAN